MPLARLLPRMHFDQLAAPEQLHRALVGASEQALTDQLTWH